MNNDYLKYHFASPSGKSELWSRATGSTALGIKGYHLKATLVTVPPLAEQKAIASYLDQETLKLDNLMEKIRQSIATQKEYRTALISAAVTGKIDVR
jgi:type I restriction enzyme S subunit